MKQQITFLLYFFIFLTLTSCSKSEVQFFIEHKANRDDVSIISNEIAKNTIDELPSQNIEVYLPENYDTKGDPYPVVYFLSGFSGSASYYRNFILAMFDEMNKSVQKTFILVSVSGYNKFDGSFYANSKITGNWEDYIMKEVLPIVEKSYNVSKNKSKRGIAGHSMGGFGALKLGMKYPDYFDKVFAFAPGAYIESEINLVLDDWKNFISPSGKAVILKAYSAAFTESDKVPTLDGSSEDNEIVKQWNTGMSNWNDKIDRYMKQDKKLKKIRIVVGDREEHVWISSASKHIAALLDNNNITHELYFVDATHEMSKEILINEMLPFFSDSF